MANVVTAKITCTNKTEQGEGEHRQVNVSFGADYADGRNKEWALYTPGLSLMMGLRGPVADRFEVGKSYELRFIEEGAALNVDAVPDSSAEEREGSS
jgi:hypothetical protein